ncbi:hypothetical protein BR93DRAFT_628408 [Coniochaeta sp. PMI_546]|nr:hypothetical protein BR93DRAFT_628408 [Coniochaeta sp. PMI_546]
MPADSVLSKQSVSALLDSPAGKITETFTIQTTSSTSSTTLRDLNPPIALRPLNAAAVESNTMPQKRTLTIRNYSSRPQSFVLLASPPAFAPLAVPDVVRHCVYQASLLVAAETGSHTFIIPVLGGQTDLEATAAASRPVYAVTGCARQKPDPGVALFVSDVHALQEGDGVGPAERCRMTMPDGFEAAFSKAKMPNDPDDDDPVANSKGTVGIETDNSFDASCPGYPFIGLGAPNPYNPREIVPIVTWDAVPGNAYLVRPNLHTWIVARDTAEKGSIYELTQSTKVETVSFTSGDVAAEVIFEKNGTFTLIKGVS